VRWPGRRRSPRTGTGPAGARSRHSANRRAAAAGTRHGPLNVPLSDKHLRRADGAPFCWGIFVGSSHRNIFKADEVWIIGRPVIIGSGLIWVPQFVQFSAVAAFARLISHL